MGIDDCDDSTVATSVNYQSSAELEASFVTDESQALSNNDCPTAITDELVRISPTVQHVRRSLIRTTTDSSSSLPCVPPALAGLNTSGFYQSRLDMSVMQGNQTLLDESRLSMDYIDTSLPLSEDAHARDIINDLRRELSEIAEEPDSNTNDLMCHDCPDCRAGTPTFVKDRHLSPYASSFTIDDEPDTPHVHIYEPPREFITNNNDNCASSNNADETVTVDYGPESNVYIDATNCYITTAEVKAASLIESFCGSRASLSDSAISSLSSGAFTNNTPRQTHL